MTSLSPRQQILRTIWETPGPDALIARVAVDRAFRDPALAAELEQQAGDLSQYDVSSAGILLDMAEALRECHQLATVMAGCRDLAGLRDAASTCRLVWHPEFSRLMEAFADDAMAEGNQPLAESLIGARELRRRVWRVLETVLAPSSSTDLRTRFEEEPLLRDPTLHDILHVRWKHGQQRGEPGMEQLARLIEYLRMRTRLDAAFTEPRQPVPGDSSRVRMRLPTTPDQAKWWFLFCFGPSEVERVFEIARGVIDGRIEIDDAVSRTAHLMNEEGRSTPAQLYPWSILAEFLTRTATVAGIVRGLDLYQEKTQGVEWEASLLEIQATFILRFSFALMRCWRAAPDGRTRLERIVQHISAVLPGLAEEISPRLIRDLLFERARARENLASWDTAQLTLARTDYESGLAISAVAHEVAARAGALSDLANVWRKLPAVPRETSEKRAEELFQEALALLPSDEFPEERSNVCVNYGILLHEKTRPDRSEVLERALALINEAIAIRQNARTVATTTAASMPSLAPPANHDDVLASAYQTKANILREWLYGDPATNLQIARNSLQEALRLVRREVNPQLYGTIRLNLGHTYMDMNDLSDEAEAGLLNNALHCYEEALETLSGYPEGRAMVLRDTVGIMMELARAGEGGVWARAEQRLTEALQIFAELGDIGGIGRVHQNFGVLCREREDLSEDTRFTLAIGHFTEAARCCEQDGDLAGALIAHRCLAGLHARIYLQTRDRAACEQAASALSDAARLADLLWPQLFEMDAQHAFSQEHAWIHNEMAWVQAQLGAPAEKIWWSISRGKGRQLREHLGILLQAKDDLPPHLSERFYSLWHRARILQVGKWGISREPNTDEIALENRAHRESIAEALRDYRGARRQLAPYYATDFQDPEQLRAEVQARLGALKDAVVLDLATCRWGTVTIALSVINEEVVWPPVVSLSPLTLSDCVQVLWGRGEDLGWLDTYFGYRSAVPASKNAARVVWAEATDRLLQMLGQGWAQLLDPSALHPTPAHAELVLLPSGVLGAVPLHAAHISGSQPRYLYERFAGICYCPSLYPLTRIPTTWRLPHNALLVLSDPEQDPTRQLRGAIRELTHAAQALVQGGSTVMVAAALGERVGREVFPGALLPENVSVLNGRPSREWLKDHLPEYEHIFYAGHGRYGTSGDLTGLVLPTADGSGVELLSLDSILELPILDRRPTLYLSACETATPEPGDVGAECMTLAGCFVRAGGSWVCGSLWTVRDDCAEKFSESFYESLAQRNRPTRAVSAAISALRAHLRKGPDTSGVPGDHPIYWAGILPIGWPL